MERKIPRRRILELTGGVVGIGTVPQLRALTPTAGERRVEQSKGPSQSAEPAGRTEQDATETDTILEGTEHATTVYVRRADADGPTVMVSGGIHGSETSGYRAANDVKTWEIDAGTLVVLPEANKVAIERGTRGGEHGDLNRHFPMDKAPSTELAQGIWEAVRRYDPDMFIDLHQASGIYSEDSTGNEEEEVGQAIFFTGDAAAPLARSVATHVNETEVPDSRPRYAFETDSFDVGEEPSGLLATKVALDLGARSFLVEVTSKDLDLDTRVRWTTQIVRRFLVEEAVIAAKPANDLQSTPDENVAPEAKIITTPADAETIDFTRGETVTLDGSNSSVPDGTIAAYEWDVDDDGTFNQTGAAVELPLTSCGTFPVTLRVTADDGATATATITLSTSTQQA